VIVRTPKDIGRLIKAARKNQQLTQVALADRVGTTQRRISFIENGRPGTSIDLVLRALAILKIRLDGQLPGDRHPSLQHKTASLIDKIADQRRKKNSG
jgi:transcriptional regulator with XRE-family HTH domain